MNPVVTLVLASRLQALRKVFHIVAVTWILVICLKYIALCPQIFGNPRTMGILFRQIILAYVTTINCMSTTVIIFICIVKR